MSEGAVQKLEKPGQKLGFSMCVALVMGNMIGSGVFLLPASLAPYGWNAVIAWVITVSGALTLAYLLAKLTTSLPHRSGPTGFVTEAFGSVPGFLIGWSYLVSIWTAVVTIAVAGVSYMSEFLPVLAQAPAISALILLWGITALNIAGTRVVGGFQIATTLLKLVPILIVIVLAFFLLADGTRPQPAATWIEFGAINASMALTLWALLGFEAASVAAEKVDNPEKTVPRAMMLGTAFTGLLYLFVCSAIAMFLPTELVSNSPAPFATFVGHFWSPAAAQWIAIFAAISCIGALNGWVLMQGELPRNMAAQGMLPAQIARTNSAGTPIHAILISSVIASIFLVMNASKAMKALFEFLLLLSTSATLWLYLACAIAALRLRIAIPAAVVGGVYSIWTLWGAGVEASGLSLALMLAGLPLYWFATRANARSANSERQISKSGM